jgi:hypothetical protein
VTTPVQPHAAPKAVPADLGVSPVAAALPACIDPALLDADQRVAGDVACVGCGYNLRTLAVDARCPECGQAVAESLCRDGLEFGPPAWVRGLAGGAGLLLCAAVCVVVLLAAAGLALLAEDSLAPADVGVLLTVFAGVAGILGGLALLAGTLIITGRNPRLRRRPEGATGRRALRYSLLVELAVAAVASRTAWIELADLFLLLVATAVLVQPLLLLRHTATLAGGLPDGRLARTAKNLLICHIMGVCLSFGVMIVAMAAKAFPLVLVIPAGVVVCAVMLAVLYLRLMWALAAAAARAERNAKELASFAPATGAPGERRA